MLVIRRRAGESFLIGDAVEVEILEMTGGQVKLGIRAPREITILRKEVHLTAEQNRKASRAISKHQLAVLKNQLQVSLTLSTPDR